MEFKPSKRLLRRLSKVHQNKRHQQRKLDGEAETPGLSKELRDIWEEGRHLMSFFQVHCLPFINPCVSFFKD